MKSQVTSKGCSKSFILCVCYRALYHSSVQFVKGSEITFPFNESDVLGWFNSAKEDSLDQELQELLGGTMMNHADPTTYWTKPEQFQTWWKNNMERKTKTLSLQKDSQYTGDNENRIKRARYCRGAITICTNIKSYFERKIIQHGGFVINVEISLKMPLHMPVPIAPPSFKVRPRLTQNSCKKEIKVISKNINFENISLTTQTTSDDSILLKRKLEHNTCEAKSNNDLTSRLDTAIYRSLFLKSTRTPDISPTNEIIFRPILSDDSCRYKHASTDSDNNKNLLLKQSLSCGESENPLLDTKYNDTEELNVTHESTISTICDMYNISIFGYNDRTEDDDYELCCLFFDSSPVDGTTSSVRNDSVSSYPCGFSRDSLNTVSNDIISDEYQYPFVFDNNDKMIESTSFAYDDWLIYKDLSSMYRPAVITAPDTNTKEKKQTTFQVNHTSFDDLSKLIYNSDYMINTCESDDVNADDTNEVISTLKDQSTMMAEDLIDFYDDEDNEVGFSAVDK